MRVLIVSDIHANPWALAAVLEQAGFVDKVICAGDIVNYGPNPAAAISMLRARDAFCVCGNHDRAVATRADPKAAPQKAALAIAMRDWTHDQLSVDDLDWLLSLDQFAVWPSRRASFSIVHATPVDPFFDYRLTPDVDDESLARLVGSVTSDVLVVGHTHLPLLRYRNRLQIINPGSVGQPLDGDSRAAYAVWEDGFVQLERAEYDQTPVLNAIAELPLAEPHRDALQSILRNARA